VTSLIGQIRFYGTVLLAALALVALLPFHFIALYMSGRSTMKVAQLWQRFVCFLIGIRVTVTGGPADNRPLLLLSNHNSWLDIPILAGVAPVSFVAKREVASWPVVGFLARTQRTVFVDRARRHATGAHADEMAGRLSKGDILVLFAEGTSSDGNKVLPFRSALVGAAQRAIEDGGSATVQPVAIAYQKMLGLPLGRQHRPLVAWYGGTDLLPHLKRILSEGGIDVHVVFGPARTLSATDNRKAATQEAGELVRKVVAAINGGRDPADVLAAAALEPAREAQARRREDRPAEAAE
jgi:1-acyl-sn-glycerol-3-phosphate acyltransferase